VSPDLSCFLHEGTRRTTTDQQKVRDDAWVLDSFVLLDPLARFHPPRKRKAARKQAYLRAVKTAQQAVLPLTHGVEQAFREDNHVTTAPNTI
jgi:hypothetical protein